MLKKSNRHDMTVKKFGLALLIMTGKAGYELLQRNLGDALPGYGTLQRMMSLKERLVEGHFYFDELLNHLRDWEAPFYVHVHLDDTRIKNRIDYDAYCDRFVGFVLPLRDGLPVCDAFVLQTFEEIKNAFDNSTVAKYAHCIVIKPIKVDAPSFVLAVLGTDSKYDHTVITQRWQYIGKELLRRGVTVISNGSDGAGPFLKAMIAETKLFSVSKKSNVPPSWTFYVMPEFKKRGLCAQDTVHLLAKLRTRALGPSNITQMGAESCLASHFQYILKEFGKDRHGLTQRMIKNNDKQNYTSIAVLVGDGVKECLNDAANIMRTKGTVVYLDLMRKIRDCHFEKGISPVKRVSILWEVIFFIRIWRCWLNDNGMSESDHFITTNAYTCIELNGHLLVNMVYNVINGFFPKEVLRMWYTGSQSCEELFRLLRSMTPTFSTIINFSMKGMMERIHRLTYISSIESSEDIIFPRVKRRLLQLNEETEETFLIPTMEELESTIRKAKDVAKALAKECKMDLSCYDDEYLMRGTTRVIKDAIANDLENEDVLLSESQQEESSDEMAALNIAHIREDLAVIKLKKKPNSSFPIYTESTDKGSKTKHSYTSVVQTKKYRKTPFVEYNGAFIRKVTALYLLQENFQVSNDRLLRVRSCQQSHIFSSAESDQNGNSGFVKIGDLCVFTQELDKSKALIGRVVQFSYMAGNKRAREYSSTYVDTSSYVENYKDGDNDIGAFANWFARRDVAPTDLVFIEPLELVFQAGYLSMSNYVATIDESSIIFQPDGTIAIAAASLSAIVPEWKDMISLHDDLSDM